MPDTVLNDGYITKGMQISYCATASGTFTALTDLLECPELGGDRDSIEITTLADGAHRYRDGLKNYGDAVNFTFLYDPTQFATLNGLSGVQYLKVELPDGENGALDTACTFSGTCSVKLNSAAANDVFKYTLSIRPNSEMNFA